MWWFYGTCRGWGTQPFEGADARISGRGFSPDGQILASWSTVEGCRSEDSLGPGMARRLLDIPGITGYVLDGRSWIEGRGLVILEHDLNHDAAKSSWSPGTSLEVRYPCRRVPSILCSKMADSPGGAGWRPALPMVTSRSASGDRRLRSRLSPSLSPGSKKSPPQPMAIPLP